ISWKTRARSPFVRSAASSARTSAGESSGSWRIVGSTTSPGCAGAPRDRSRGIAGDGSARLRSTWGLRGDDPVATAALRIEKGPVGLLDRRRDRLLGIDGHGGTDGDADRRDTVAVEVESRDGLAD